jgi:hypothetical protein
MSFALNEQTKRSIEKTTGIPYNEIIAMDVDVLDEKILEKVGKKRLPFNSDDDSRLPNMRGAPYWNLGRLFSFNTKKMDRYINRL